MLVVLMVVLIHGVRTTEGLDAQQKANYTVIHLESCPDEGYLFKKELPVNGTPGVCQLCFCETFDTVVCWKREVHRCDAEQYHTHGIGRRHVRVSRSLGFADVFLRDAAREVFNRQEPQQCVPYRESKSEGCPPVDWCLGCTVCECDANGRWNCHILSFCNNKQTKKKVNPKKKVRLDLLDYPLPLPTTPTTTIKTKKTPRPWKPTPRPKPTTKKPKPRNLRRSRSQQRRKPQQITTVRSNNTRDKKIIKKRNPAQQVTATVQKRKTTKKFTNKISAKTVIKNNTWKMVVNKMNVNKTVHNKDPKKVNLNESEKTVSFNTVSKLPLFKNKMFNELAGKDNNTAIIARRVMKNMMSVLKKIAIRNITRDRLDEAEKYAKAHGLYINNKWSNCTLSNEANVTPEPFNIPNFLKGLNLRNKRQVVDGNEVLKNVDGVTNLIFHDGASQTTPFKPQSHNPMKAVVSDISNSASIANANTSQPTEHYYQYSIENADITKILQVQTEKDQANDTVTVFELKSHTPVHSGRINKNKSKQGNKGVDYATLKTETTDSVILKTTSVVNGNDFTENSRGHSLSSYEISKIIYPKSEQTKIHCNKSLTKYFSNKMVNPCRHCVQKNNINISVSPKLFANKLKNKNEKFLRLNVLSYLRKFFRKMYSPWKSKLVKKNKPLDKKSMLYTLCHSYNLCATNANDFPDIEAKIASMSKEGNRIMRSIKIIYGLLKLINLPFNQTNEKGNGSELRNKSNIKKLNFILAEEYLESNNNTINLTDTQLKQINYIKVNTQVFIQSLNKFAEILHEMINKLNKKPSRRNKKYINILRAYKNNTVKPQHFIDVMGNKHDKTYPSCSKVHGLSREVKSDNSIEAIKKLKNLFLNYNAIQNTFFKRVIESLDNLQRPSNKLIPGAVTKRDVLSKSMQIDDFSKKIIGNLRKLKDLASKLSSKRSKRSINEDHELDYMLMFMENLMRRQNMYEVFPVNDGIDLLIDAIKHAPEIKPIQKIVANSNLKSIRPFQKKKFIPLKNLISSPEKDTKFQTKYKKFQPVEDGSLTTAKDNEVESGALDNYNKESTSGPNNKYIGDIENGLQEFEDQNESTDKIINDGNNNESSFNRRTTNLPKNDIYDNAEVTQDRLVTEVDSKGKQKNFLRNSDISSMPIYRNKAVVIGNSESFGAGVDDVVGVGFIENGRLVGGGGDGDDDRRHEFYNSDSEDDEKVDQYTTTATSETQTDTNKDSTIDTVMTRATKLDNIENKVTTEPNKRLLQWFEDSNEEQNAVTTTKRVATRTRKYMTTLEPATEDFMLDSKKRKKKKIFQSDVLRMKQMELLNSLDYETEKIATDASGENQIKWMETNNDKFSSEVQDNTAYFA